MKAEIICIGTELLLGQIVDTNAAFLARELADLGIDLFHKTTVGDNLERAVAALKRAWERADLLLISGGLGPTQDDLTREAVARLLDEELEFDAAAWEEINAYFQKVQRPIPESNRRQALFPPSGRLVINQQGTAPGVLVAKDGHYLVAFPGVPRELQAMWQEQIKPYLCELLTEQTKSVLSSRLIRIVGIGEAAMEEKIIDLIKAQTNPTIAPYAGSGEVCLRVTAKGRSESANQKLIAAATARIEQRLGKYIYGYDQDTLEAVVGRLLQERGWRLAVAESCSGGLLTHRITNVSGSSAYFWGGISSYHNSVKIDLLGVPAALLAAHGAVSREVAQAMAEGVRQKLGVEVGLALTGIAGPDGGSLAKPVGLVYLALASPDRTEVKERRFALDRIGNKEAAAQAALVLLWQSLIKQK